MKIIIEAYGVTINEFDPAEVDSIRVFRHFDVDLAARHEAPYVVYVNHFNKPIPKSGRILAVYLFNHADQTGTYHLYDPDNCLVTFK